MRIDLVVIGALFFVAAVRTFQPRVALAGLPLILLGGLAWWRGWAAARLLAFPVFLLYFVIPVPGMIQATNGLQLLATKSAYHLSKLFGMNASLSGNDIFSVPVDKWNFNIAEGCSGVRSLMALMLVSAVYAHLTQKTLWKKFVLFACSVPLAILSNCLRVASILIVAEYFSADFAAKTYHEGSGFLVFPRRRPGRPGRRRLVPQPPRPQNDRHSKGAGRDRRRRSGRPASHAVSQGRLARFSTPHARRPPFVPHGPPARHPGGSPARLVVARVHPPSLRGGARRGHQDGAAGKPVVLDPDRRRPDRISVLAWRARCPSARRNTGCWPATPNLPKSVTCSPTSTPSNRSSTTRGLVQFGELLAVQASIVLSGHDLNDSIHRPERCLPAQGFKELRLEPRVVPTRSRRRARSPASAATPKSRTLRPANFVLDPNGRPVRLQHVFYYWFVGSHCLTSDHYQRTLTDMRDRLLRWVRSALGLRAPGQLLHRLSVCPGSGRRARSRTHVVRIRGANRRLLAEAFCSAGVT